jgi:hypothetical protein
MELTKDNIAQIVEEMTKKHFPEDVRLDYKGVELKSRECLEAITNFDKINRCIKDIPKSFQKHSILGKKYWNTGSYGGKHTIEDIWTDEGRSQHLSNGEFIFAMLLLGYEMKPYEVKIREKMFKKEPGITPNVTFNASKRDFSKVMCDCGNQYSKNSKKQHQNTKLHQMIMAAKTLTTA